MNDLKFSVIMPTYNGALVIGETLRSILSQGFLNFEIIISDDASTDNTEKIARSFSDPRIKFFKNAKNLGYPGNLNAAMEHARGDIIFLMGQDDILGTDALRNTYQAFKISGDIGAVTRPYFWFDEKIDVPVRAKKQLNAQRNEVVRISDNPERIVAVFETLDQLSGLAYRREFMDLPFHPDIFPCHVYPFASIFKKHPIVYLKDYNVAVRIRSSQSRKISSIYDKSPILSWVEMFETVFKEDKFKKIRAYCVAHFVAVNYVGLLQIKNYARFKYLLREIGYLLKYRWQNIFSIQFWFFSLLSILTPPFILILTIDWYKNKIYAKTLTGIKFKYEL